MNPEPGRTSPERLVAPAQRFLAAARSEGMGGPHPASMVLLRRARAHGRRRLAEFLRIERGREA